MTKGQIVGIDWNRIARLHSHVLDHMNSLTLQYCPYHIKAQISTVRDSQIYSASAKGKTCASL